MYKRYIGSCHLHKMSVKLAASSPFCCPWGKAQNAEPHIVISDANQNKNQSLTCNWKNEKLNYLWFVKSFHRAMVPLINCISPTKGPEFPPSHFGHVIIVEEEED